MGKPDFIGIGMERAGSSWLFYMLAVHPQIWVPPIKELHYFEDPGPNKWRYGPHLKSRALAKLAPFFKTPASRPQYFKNTYAEYLAWDARYFSGTRSDQWYASLFDEKFTKGRICGEVTAAYAAMNEERIAALVKLHKSTKIILSLRDPVERMLSAMFHDFRSLQRLKPEQITESMMLEWLRKRAGQNPASNREILARWQKHTDAKNLIVINFADIAKNPEKLVSGLYTALGVDSSFRPPPEKLHEKIFSFRDDAPDVPPSILAAAQKFFAQPEGENHLTVSPRAKKS